MLRNPACLIATLLLLACRAEPAADAFAPAASAIGVDTAAVADSVLMRTALADDDDCLPIEPERVWIAGTVRQEPRFGPPNYGEEPETDRKLTITVIDLDRPVSVCEKVDPDEPYDRVSEVRRVQLAGMYDQARVRRSIDRRIRVNGTLFHAISGYHFTSILISVDSVAPAVLDTAIVIR